jgi:hypothetical protein
MTMYAGGIPGTDVLRPRLKMSQAKLMSSPVSGRVKPVQCFGCSQLTAVRLAVELALKRGLLKPLPPIIAFNLVFSLTGVWRIGFSAVTRRRESSTKAEDGVRQSV